MKPRVQSSRAHSSLPVSPIEQKEKVPSPKQVWQAEEKPKLQPVQETKPEPIPVKKEISITLVSPQPDGLLSISPKILNPFYFQNFAPFLFSKFFKHPPLYQFFNA